MASPTSPLPPVSLIDGHQSQQAMTARRQSRTSSDNDETDGSGVHGKTSLRKVYWTRNLDIETGDPQRSVMKVLPDRQTKDLRAVSARHAVFHPHQNDLFVNVFKTEQGRYVLTLGLQCNVVCLSWQLRQLEDGNAATNVLCVDRPCSDWEKEMAANENLHWSLVETHQGSWRGQYIKFHPNCSDRMVLCCDISKPPHKLVLTTEAYAQSKPTLHYHFILANA